MLPQVRYRVQAMSALQHIGDLILPWSFGHRETCTLEPSSPVSVSLTSGASQVPQMALMDMPQEAHSYVAIGGSPRCNGTSPILSHPGLSPGDRDPLARVGRISNTIGLAKVSWEVLRKDRDLLVFPLLSFLVSIVVLAMSWLPTVMSIDPRTMPGRHPRSPRSCRWSGCPAPRLTGW